MKKKLLIPIVLLITIAYSCTNNQKEKNSLSRVNGIYSIGGAEINGEKNIVDSLQTLGILNFENSEFNFMDNDSVYIDSESAKKFFGGTTAFKYEFADKNLVLTDNKTRIEIPCSVSKSFKNVDLEITFTGIKKIELIRLDK